MIAGRYRLVEQLGANASGSLWRADDTELGREVAVQLLGANAAFDSASANLAHEHIVRLFDHGETGEERYLVVEYLAGGSLERRLEQGAPLAEREARDIADDVAGALAYAHSQGAVHGSLRAACVLFDTEGRTKVAGFDQASSAGAGADVRAFGELLFRMLTGRVPPAEADRAELEAALAEASPALAAVALAAIGSEPRPADGAALLELLHESPPLPPQVEQTTRIAAPPPVARARPRRSLLLSLAAGAALLGAGIAAGLLATSGDSGGKAPSIARILTRQPATGSTVEPSPPPPTSQTTGKTTTASTASTETGRTTVPPATTAPQPTPLPPPTATEELPPTTTEELPPPTTEATTPEITTNAP